jgi:hypothetical protein
VPFGSVGAAPSSSTGGGFTIFSDSPAADSTQQQQQQEKQRQEKQQQQQLRGDSDESNRTADFSALAELMQADQAGAPSDENGNENSAPLSRAAAPAATATAASGFEVFVDPSSSSSSSSNNNRENKTPPRGLSNSDRRHRSLAQEGVEQNVLKPVPMSTVLETESDDVDEEGGFGLRLGGGEAHQRVLSPRLRRMRQAVESEVETGNSGSSRSALFPSPTPGLFHTSSSGSSSLFASSNLGSSDGLGGGLGGPSAGSRGLGLGGARHGGGHGSGRVEEFSIAGDIYKPHDDSSSSGGGGTSNNANSTGQIPGGGVSGRGTSAALSGSSLAPCSDGSTDLKASLDDCDGDFSSRLAAFDFSDDSVMQSGPFSASALCNQDSAAVTLASAPAPAPAPAAGTFSIFSDDDSVLSRSKCDASSAAPAPTSSSSGIGSSTGGGFTIFSDAKPQETKQPKKQKKGDRRKTASPGSLQDLMQALTEEDF